MISALDATMATDALGEDRARVAQRLRQAAAVVVDFDGTLVDSNGIKRRAFAECFAQAGPAREQVLAYCWGHHDIPRDDKFRHVYEAILGHPYTPDIAACLHAQFEGLTTQAVIDAPEIAGALAFVRKARRGRLIGLLSSTPEAILRRIITARGWIGEFDLIQGSPVDKAAWLRALGERLGVTTQAIIALGDSAQDGEAAAAARTPFIQIGDEPIQTPALYAAADFRPLIALLEDHA